MNGLVWDRILEQQMQFECEQLHVLTALYGVACGNVPSDTNLKVAKSLELMKAATLVVDDFLDKAATRNGLPSLFSQRGAEEAVLIGEILRSTALIKLSEALGAIPAAPVARTISLFEQAYRLICLGQLEDRQLEGAALTPTAPSEKDYFSMITHTSAAFIQLPLVLGATLAGRDAAATEGLAAYGLDIGLAYQVRDDVLDVIASPALTGKPRAGDLTNRKKRLPVLRLRDACDGADLAVLLPIMNVGRPLSASEVHPVLAMMEKYQVVPSCEATVSSLCSKALRSIEGRISVTEYQQLEAIAQLLTDFSFLEADSEPIASQPG